MMMGLLRGFFVDHVTHFTVHLPVFQSEFTAILNLKYSGNLSNRKSVKARSLDGFWPHSHGIPYLEFVQDVVILESFIVNTSNTGDRCEFAGLITTFSNRFSKLLHAKGIIDPQCDAVETCRAAGQALKWSWMRSGFHQQENSEFYTFHRQIKCHHHHHHHHHHPVNYSIYKQIYRLAFLWTSLFFGQKLTTISRINKKTWGMKLPVSSPGNPECLQRLSGASTCPTCGGFFTGRSSWPCSAPLGPWAAPNFRMVGRCWNVGLLVVWHAIFSKGDVVSFGCTYTYIYIICINDICIYICMYILCIRDILIHGCFLQLWYSRIIKSLWNGTLKQTPTEWGDSRKLVGMAGFFPYSDSVQTRQHTHECSCYITWDCTTYCWFSIEM